MNPLTLANLPEAEEVFAEQIALALGNIDNLAYPLDKPRVVTLTFTIEPRPEESGTVQIYVSGSYKTPKRLSKRPVTVRNQKGNLKIERPAEQEPLFDCKVRLVEGAE